MPSLVIFYLSDTTEITLLKAVGQIKEICFTAFLRLVLQKTV